MIHMLSRFDLKPGTDVEAFKQHYYRFAERAKLKGLAHATGKIGERVSNTPMDTDADDAPRYYVIMSFLDRKQIDRAYEFLNSDPQDPADRKPHAAVKHAVCHSVFTCWQDETVAEGKKPVDGSGNLCQEEQTQLG